MNFILKTVITKFVGSKSRQGWNSFQELNTSVQKLSLAIFTFLAVWLCKTSSILSIPLGSVRVFFFPGSARNGGKILQCPYTGCGTG